MSFSNAARKILHKMGDHEITKIQICRTPLSSTIKFLLNITSEGEFQKRINESGADKFFHLFMLVTCDVGAYQVEKNEVITITNFKSFGPDTETIDAKPEENMSLYLMLEKTKNRMDDRFFTYMARDNSCSDFIENILHANDLATPEIIAFVTQETRQLFDGNARFRKIVNSVTDVGAIASKAVDSVQNISKSVGNELLKIPYTGLTLNNIYKKGFSILK